MTRALVTFAEGPEHERLLEIAAPTFRAFADRHGYEMRIGLPSRLITRPPSWKKIPALLSALEEYDEALWLDADTLIVDPSQDLPVTPGAWQALVEHHTPDGRVPNLGVWLVRRPMISILRQMWDMRQYVNHGWWEQAAMMDLLGYTLTRPTRLLAPTVLHDRTVFLDSGWNRHPWDTQTAERLRVLHATMYPDRATTMRNWVLQADRLADPAAVPI